MKNTKMASSERRKAYEHVAQSLAMRYDTIYYVDVDTGKYIVFSSTDAYRDLELSPDGADFFAEIRKRAEVLIHPEDRNIADPLLMRDTLIEAIAGARAAESTFRVLRNGDYIFMNVHGMWADDHRHLVVGFKDVDQWERARREEAQRTQIYSHIAQTLAHRYDFIYYVDIEDGRCMRFNSKNGGQQAEFMHEKESFFELARMQIQSGVHRDDKPLAALLSDRAALLAAVDREGVHSVTVRYKRRRRYAYINLRAMRAEDRRHIIVAVSDVDKKIRDRQAEARNLRDAEMRAMRDELTRVSNKNAYTELEEELQRAIDEGSASPMAIVVCDVNDLKGVNDGQGHKAGDALLQAASRLICVTYAHSPVFRVGGDEFAVVLRGEDYENRYKLLASIRSEAQQHLRDGGAVVAVGMSEYNDDSFITDVFERADRDMYENKRALKMGSM